MTDAAPKAEGTSAYAGVPIRNVWRMFLYAWDLLPKRPRLDTSVERASDPALLIAAALADALERRARAGLPRGYVARRGEIGAVRGRMDVARSVQAHAFERGRVHCRFEEYSVDTPRNRLIKGTLARLFADPALRRRTASTADLRKRLERSFAGMAGVATGSVTREAFRRESPGRNDAEDRLVLALCELLFLASIPTEAEGAGHLLQGERDEVLLRRVFERFVARFFDRHLSPEGWKVERQKVLHWPVVAGSAGIADHLPRMEVDVLLTSPDKARRIVVDTKFTDVLARGKEGGGARRFRSAHLYQIYAYVQTQDFPRRCDAEGLLLYPAIGLAVSEHMVLPGQVLRLETIDLARTWPEIEDSLLALLGRRAPPPEAAQHPIDGPLRSAAPTPIGPSAV